MTLLVRGMLRVAAVAVVAALAPGVAVAEEGPETDASRFESTALAQDASIAVERAVAEVIRGEPVTYTVTVANPDPEQEATAQIRASVPPRLTDVTAPDGETGETHVTWETVIEPGSTAAVQLTGAYAGPEAEAGPDRVAFTACLLGQDAQPVVCSTDLAEVHQPASTAWLWWVGGILIAAALATAGWLVLRRRRARATPAAALPPTAPLAPAAQAAVGSREGNGTRRNGQL